MGSASIAGEERDGTIGLLLGNPKSRTHVLASKAASMVLLVALAVVALWGSAYVAAAILDVEISGMHVGSFSAHLFASALFYGLLAMVVGAWSGRRGLASGVAVGVMVLSYFVAGIFQLISGWENVVKLSPWYYFDGSQPMLNGVDWVHLAVLLSGCLLFAAIAVVGVNRRDLRGQTVGVALIDRLRANPLTQKVAERLAGSARVSRMSIKTASEHQGLLIITAYAMFLIMGVMMGPLYSLFDESVLSFADDLPEAMYALFGAAGGSMSTPEGFYQVETFGMMAPLAVMVVTIVIGARALAGEEERRTMGLLLANPIKRSKVVIEKTWAMVVYAVAVGVAIFSGVAFGSVLGRLGMNIGNIAAISLLVTLLGLVFGALALAVSAATGRVKVAVWVSVGAAVALHLLNSLGSLNADMAGYARWSPYYYYAENDPLVNGMHWGNGAVLTGLTVGLVALAVVLFQRRDLRQSG
jgi:ABC-2 type transport system permease protein